MVREGDGLRCSFCQKVQDEVRKLIAGPLVFICDECVQVCVNIIEEDNRMEAAKRSGVSETPRPQHPPPMPDLMDHLAELSAADQWLLVMHLLARLRDGHLGS